MSGSLPALRPARLHPFGLVAKWLTGRDILETLGWRRAVLEAGPWLLDRRYTFFRYDLRKVPAIRPAAIPIELERAGAGNLSDFLALRPGYYTRRLLEKRLDRGHVGYLIRSGGRPVLSRWIFLQRVYLPYFRRTLVLGERDAYTDETFTARPFRRMGIFSASLSLTQAAVREMGLEWNFAAVASWNATPLKDVPRAGGIAFGGCRIIRRRGRRSVIWTGGVDDRGDGTIAFLEPDDQPGFSTT